MAKLVIMSGVPASGKSFFANALRAKVGKHIYIVSSDLTRTLVLGNQQDFSNEKLCWKMYYSLARVYSLDPDGIVILDATQATTFFRTKATANLKPLFSEVDLVVFDIKKATLMKQNLERDWPVPIDVLERMIEEFEKPNEEDEEYFDHIYTITDHNIEPIIDELIK